MQAWHVSSWLTPQAIPETSRYRVAMQSAAANQARGTGPSGVPPLMSAFDRIQRQLGQVGHLADHSERILLLGVLAASIAHEINNILTPVKAYAELALSAPDDRALVIKALERSAAGVERACRISEMILACARPLPRAVRSASPRSDVSAVVSRVVSDWSGPDPPTVRCEIEGGLMVAMDEFALEQLLVNLLLNARAAIVGGGTITIRARSTWNADGPGRCVKIEVEDTGCGIEPERLPHVFEPFSSFGIYSVSGLSLDAGAISVADRKRTGLGLPLCKRLVADAGGQIGIESRVGQGTRVTVVLPACTSEVSETGGREAA